MCYIRSIIIFLTIISLVACEDGPNFSPTAPSVVPENSSVVGRLSDGNTAISQANMGNQDCGNPNGNLLPDEDLLQRCLDGGGRIELQCGEPGYVINRGLLLKKSGTILTSNGACKAKIIAGRDLFESMLKTEDTGLHDFSIQNISFDGMVNEQAPDGPYRRRRGDCNERSPGNVVLAGRNFKFNHNESKYALCGSGLGLYGENFEVVDNLIYSNGQDKNSGIGGLPWSDGMTVLYCGAGYIAHNVLVDNTDIDLVLGGGRGCVVELNTIFHRDKHGFAGLAIGNFNGDGAGDHSGSEYRGNTVYSTRPNVISIGILVGSHPWTSRVDVKNAGRVVANTSYGNVMNFVVDGAYGGEISDNHIHDPQGEDSMCGRNRANYTVYPPHAIGVILQDGWVSMKTDDGSCNLINSQRNRLSIFKSAR